MKVSLSWLNEFVDLRDQTVQSVSDLLTFSGVEVEGIETTGVVLDEHFVVGEILECENHPTSDHLHICKVSDGSTVFQVVCGAPNARVGLKTAFAKIGAVMPGADGFEIKKAKLRGTESFGMLCSTDELGLPGNHSGIWELPAETKTGTLMQTFMPESETIYDLEITWNRPDCLSVRGIARELAALLNRPLTMPKISFEEKGENVESMAKVIVNAPDLCPRYTARVVTDLNSKAATPDFMVRRLEQCGMRSLGLAVDVTNYVMLEVGQPLHAFDHTRLADSTIIVRRAADAEKMTTLDGVERNLDSSMLVIADANKPEALAGIMGGIDSEIETDTGIVLIESALFDCAATKFTATKLGIASEASYRYSRGVDVDLADWASRRVVSLLAEFGGATVCKGVIDIDNRDKTPIEITLKYKRTCEVIGIDLQPERIKSILTSLGLSIVSENSDEATFRIPSWRVDLTLPADLIEEVTRMNGLDKIPDRLPTLAAVSQLPETVFASRVAVRHALMALGYTEAMHYSFLSKQELDAFDSTVTNRLTIPNPVSADFGVMRDSLLPQLIASLGRNAARQVESGALFEIGRVFSTAKDGSPDEDEHVSIGHFGPFGRDDLTARQAVTNEESLLWLKGAIEALARKLHAPKFTFTAINHPAFEKGFCVAISVGRKPVGMMGAVSSQMRHKFRLTRPMVVAELKLKDLTAGLGSIPRIKPVPQFPAIRKDLAFIAPMDVTYDKIVHTIRKKAPAELTNIKLFDIFISKDIGTDKRSMGFSLEFRSNEKTLKDDDVTKAFKAIIQTLKDDLGVDVREA